MAYEPILTNLALSKMSKQYISKSEVIKAFYSSNTESSRISGATNGLYRDGTYEVGVSYTKNHRGQYVIITCWKRKILR